MNPFISGLLTGIFMTSFIISIIYLDTKSIQVTDTPKIESSYISKSKYCYDVAFKGLKADYNFNLIMCSDSIYNPGDRLKLVKGER